MKYFLFFIMFYGWGAQALEIDRFYQQVAQSPAEDIWQMTEDVLLNPILTLGVADKEMRFYRASKVPAIQQVLDEIVQNVFKVEKGPLAFCHLLGSHPKTHQANLGISARASEQTAQVCEKLLNRKDKVERRLKLPKKYVFVFNVPANHPLHSWTNYTNETLIFFEEKLSEVELTARILHEMAVAFDPKVMISPQLLEPLTADYGFEIISTGPDSGTHIQNFIQIHAIPSVRYSFSIVRATIVETLFLSQLYENEVFEYISNKELFHLIKSGRDKEAVALVMRSTLQQQKFHLSLEHSLLYQQFGDDYFKRYYIDESQIEPILTALESFHFRFRNPQHTNRDLNPLEWLAIPTVGMEGQFYTRGPRPRIGGGWGKSSVPRLSALEIAQQKITTFQLKKKPFSADTLKHQKMETDEVHKKFEEFKKNPEVRFESFHYSY